MRFLTHHCFGPPADVLQLEEAYDPQPGPGEAVIQVEATPIHAGDLKSIEGERTMVRNVDTGTVRKIENAQDVAVELPQVPGIEGIGRVCAVGAGVAGLAPGDRVFLPFQCGSWREQVVAPVARLIRAPEGDAVQLSLMVNAFTADLALRDLAPLRPGDWFVQNSANSNVGRIIISLAAMRGIRTVNIVRRAELVPELMALGGTVVLVDGPDLPARVRAATRGAELPVGLDGIAGDATTQLAECLSNGATVFNFGLMSGEACKLPAWILHYKRTILRGYYAGHNLFERSVEEQERLITELAGMIAEGRLSTAIGGTYPFSRYREAVRHAAAQGTDRAGKIIFVAE